MSIKFVELRLITKCAHCDTETDGEYPVGVHLTSQNVMLAYCSNECQVCDTLDTLMELILTHEVIGVEWIPILQQIHDELYKGEHDEH